MVDKFVIKRIIEQIRKESHKRKTQHFGHCPKRGEGSALQLTFGTGVRRSSGRHSGGRLLAMT